VNTIVNEARSADYDNARWQKRFWYRRVARLGPVYLLTLLCSLPPLIMAWRSINVPPFETQIVRFVACVATALGIQTWNFSVPLWRLLNYPAWAVSCELAFYLAFPFLVPSVKRAIVVPNEGHWTECVKDLGLIYRSQYDKSTRGRSRSASCFDQCRSVSFLMWMVSS